MALSNQCKLNDSVINIAEAIELRDSARKNNEEQPIFFCTQCNTQVIPHKESSYGDAHFEHKVRNPSCSLSDPER